MEFRATPLSTSLQTTAGALSARAEQLAAHVTFSTSSSTDFGFALGLGGGLLWVQASAEDSQRFVGESGATSVAVVSARARVSARADAILLSLGLEVEP